MSDDRTKRSLCYEEKVTKIGNGVARDNETDHYDGFINGQPRIRNGSGLGRGQYGPGANDTEIKIGNTMPYSGPASAYGAIGKSDAAYLAMINDQGGINGRKINFITRDDAYSPPKTVEQIRQLVEQDGVL